MPEEPPRLPVDIDARETLVTAARQFMLRHPEVKAVGLTVISELFDPKKLGTITVGRDGPIVTHDLWLLAMARYVDAAQFAGDNAKGFIMGLNDLGNDMARRVEAMRAGGPPP